MVSDRTRKVIHCSVPTRTPGQTILLEMPSRRVLPWDNPTVDFPGPKFQRWCEIATVPPKGYLLRERGRDAPLLHLGLFGDPGLLVFSQDGQSIAWNLQGGPQIVVADLRLVQKHLAKDGLGW